MRTPTKVRLIAACALGVAACSLQEASNRDSATSSAASSTSAASARAATRGYDPDTWQAPVVDSTPDDPYEASVYRGLALVTHTRDSLPNYVGSALSCTSCHLDEGRRPNAAPMTGAYVRYPKYIDRTGAVVPIEDRINYCMTRSLAGSKLPPDSRDMQDMVAYLAYISKGVPSGEGVRGEGMPKMPPLLGDSSRGIALFTDNCARCHGSDGAGMGPIPPLWGPKSYSIGASMSREERAASFIRHNMPFDHPGTLTDQQAFDVAAYIDAMPRPDLPGKERDWPNGGAPADLPYDTKGHKAFRPPRLLARSGDPRAAIVGAPLPAPRGK